MRLKEKFEIVGAVWRIAIPAIFKRPILIFPVAVILAIKSLALVLLYFYPRPPFARIIGPILSYAKREHYMHYPANFLFITKISGHIYTIISIFFGSFLVGLMFYLVNQFVQNGETGFKEAFRATIKRYLALVIFWTVITVFAYGFFVSEGFLLKKYFATHQKLLFLTVRNVDFFLIFVNLFLTAVINLLFAYAPAAVILEKCSLLKSFIRNFTLLKGIVFPTLILVGAPMILGLPISLLRRQIPVLILKFFPEISMIVLAAGILFVFIIDALVITSVATLYTLNKEAEE